MLGQWLNLSLSALNLAVLLSAIYCVSPDSSPYSALRSCNEPSCGSHKDSGTVPVFDIFPPSLLSIVSTGPDPGFSLSWSSYVVYGNRMGTRLVLRFDRWAENSNDGFFIDWDPSWVVPSPSAPLEWAKIKKILQDQHPQKQIPVLLCGQRVFIRLFHYNEINAIHRRWSRGVPLSVTMIPPGHSTVQSLSMGEVVEVQSEDGHGRVTIDSLDRDVHGFVHLLFVVNDDMSMHDVSDDSDKYLEISLNQDGYQGTVRSDAIDPIAGFISAKKRRNTSSQHSYKQERSPQDKKRVEKPYKQLFDLPGADLPCTHPDVCPACTEDKPERSSCYFQEVNVMEELCTDRMTFLRDIHNGSKGHESSNLIYKTRLSPLEEIITQRIFPWFDAKIGHQLAVPHVNILFSSVYSDVLTGMMGVFSPIDLYRRNNTNKSNEQQIVYLPYPDIYNSVEDIGAIFAHEYQHLLHYSYMLFGDKYPSHLPKGRHADGSKKNIDEALSYFAEYHVGFSHQPAGPFCILDYLFKKVEALPQNPQESSFQLWGPEEAMATWAFTFLWFAFTLDQVEGGSSNFLKKLFGWIPLDIPDLITTWEMTRHNDGRDFFSLMNDLAQSLLLCQYEGEEYRFIHQFLKTGATDKFMKICRGRSRCGKRTYVSLQGPKPYTILGSNVRVPLSHGAMAFFELYLKGPFPLDLHIRSQDKKRRFHISLVRDA